MRHLICAILILLSNLTYGQLVSKEFGRIDLFEDFTAAGESWSLKNTEREVFTISNEIYRMQRLSNTFFSVSMPQEYVEYGSFEVSVKMEVKPDKTNPDASGGIIFMGQNAGNGALALEVNAAQQFRLLILRNGAMHPLFPDTDNGWVFSRDLKKNKSNLFNLRSFDGNYDVYINGEYQQSFINEVYMAGAIGFYINAGSTLEVDFIKISVEEGQYLADNPDQVDPEDIEDETYSQLILMFKNKIDDQQEEISRLQRELSMCKNSLTTDTAARRQNTTLRAENRGLQDRIQKIEAQLTKMQTRLEYLESMKKDIENSQNGDLVIGLTDLLSKEKKKNSELSQKVAELEKEIEMLKKGN